MLNCRWVSILEHGDCVCRKGIYQCIQFHAEGGVVGNTTSDRLCHCGRLIEGQAIARPMGQFPQAPIDVTSTVGDLSTITLLMMWTYSATWIII